MIRVEVGNNFKRETVIVDNDTTLREVLEEQGIDYSRGMTSIDGTFLRPGDIDKSFADFGIKEKAKLVTVAKTDNA